MLTPPSFMRFDLNRQKLTDHRHKAGGVQLAFIKLLVHIFMKIIVFLIAAIAQIVAAVFGLFILLLGLNGFSEREATPSLIFYIVLSLATIVGDGVVGVVLAKKLASTTKFGVGGASVVATLSAVILGVVILIAGLFVAFVLANVVHGMR